MDKLKKFQSYQFWVLLGIAVILPLVGWFMARSGFVAQALAQEDSLNKLSESLAFSPEDPNPNWEQGLSALNAVQEKQVRIAWEQLYNLQKERMVWPKTVGQDPSKFELKEQNYYRNAYAAEVERAWKVLNPVVYSLDGTRSGIVDFPFEYMPRYDEVWEGQSRAPTIKEMESVQEDLWLLTTLFRSIARVNENSASPYDAVVRQLIVVNLRGGSKTFPGGAGGAGDMMGESAMDGGAAGGHGGGAMIPSMGGSGGMGGDAGMGGGGMSGGVASASFDPSDEFGIEVDAAGAPGAAGSATGSAAMPDEDAMAGMVLTSGGSFGESGMGNNRGGTSLLKERYVDQNDKWKTRGFYLELVIDHTRLPDVLVALSNSDWPVRITRVQQTDLKEEVLVDAAGGVAGGLPGGSMPGEIGSGRSFAPQGMGSAAMGSAMSGGYGRPSMGSRPMGAASAVTSIDGGLTNEPDPLDDPILAHVAISGLITLYKPPLAEAAPAAVQGQDQTVPAPSAQGQGTEPPAAAGVPTATPPAAASTEGAAAEAAPAEKPAGDSSKPADEKAENKPTEGAPAVEPAKESKPDPAGGAKPGSS